MKRRSFLGLFGAAATTLARELQTRAEAETRKLHFDIDFTKLTARLRSIQARYESQQPVPLA